MRQAGSAYFNAAVETMSADETAAMQLRKLARQLDYLKANSPFHAAKLAGAGAEPGDIRSLVDLARLPFTEKAELRESQRRDPPLGSHAAASMKDVVRVHASSGTTGTPSFIGLTAYDARPLGRVHRAQLLGPGASSGERLRHGAFHRLLRRRPAGRRGCRGRRRDPAAHRHRSLRPADRLHPVDESGRACDDAFLRSLPRGACAGGDEGSIRRRSASGGSWSAPSPAAAFPKSARRSRKAGARAARKRSALPTSSPSTAPSARRGTGAISWCRTISSWRSSIPRRAPSSRRTGPKSRASWSSPISTASAIRCCASAPATGSS